MSDEFSRYLSLQASAGSGKTFALTARYISLLFMGANPSNIVALTFTNKAAAEMKERIASALAYTPSAVGDDPLFAAVAASCGKSAQDIANEWPVVYSSFVKSYPKIVTIDAFFTKALRSFGMHAGVMPDFEILRLELDEIRRLFLKQISKNGAMDKLVELCIFENKKLSQIVQLFESFYENDFAISDYFSQRRIAADMGALIGAEHAAMATANRIRELFLSCEQLSDAAKEQMSFDSFEALLKKAWTQKESLNYHYYKKCFRPEADELLQTLQKQLKGYFIEKEKLFLSELKELYLTYRLTRQRHQKEQSRLDFTSVTNLCCDIFLKNRRDDGEFLYFLMDERIDHLLIDEFQDTSMSQFRLLSPIASEIVSGVGQKSFRSFFCVGDEKQSIYRFRGADKGLFSLAKERFRLDSAALTYNYRSKSEIVSFVNSVFSEHFEGFLHQSSVKDGGLVQVAVTEEPLEQLVHTVKELLSQGYAPDDIAVLCYTNDDAESALTALKENIEGLAVQAEANLLLINQKSVSALIELLKYLYFGEDIFKANFLACIGQDIFGPLDISVFGAGYKRTPLPQLIKTATEHFGLHDGSLSLPIFLQRCFGYKDLCEFVYNYEKIDDLAPKESSHGVKILTVHKSKGLQFNCCLLLDRLSKKRPNSDNLIKVQQDGELKELFFRFENRKYFDERFNAALLNEAKLSAEDELNGCYVAFTRAVEALFVIAKPKDSAYEQLALSECSRGQLPQKSAKTNEAAAKTDDKTLQHITPKRFGAQTDIQSVIKEDGSGNFDERYFGVAAHYCLEMAPSFCADGVAHAMHSVKNRFGLYLGEQRLNKVQKMAETLINDQLFLSLTGEAKLYREQMLLYKNEILRLDLLCLKKTHAVIIDYKTGAKREAHAKQLLEYKEAVEAIYKMRSEIYICHIREEGVYLTEVVH